MNLTLLSVLLRNSLLVEQGNIYVIGSQYSDQFVSLTDSGNRFKSFNTQYAYIIYCFMHLYMKLSREKKLN